MRGVYMASQIGANNSIHTRVTYNRGASWEDIKRPDGANCVDEAKVRGKGEEAEAGNEGRRVMLNRGASWKDNMCR